MKKTKENKKYWFENYKPNKNAKPVTYKGTEYLSKAQCMALEGITRKELDEYLSGETAQVASILEAPEEDTYEVGATEEELAIDQEDDLLDNILA